MNMDFKDLSCKQGMFEQPKLRQVFSAHSSVLLYMMVRANAISY
jgi:hypothetical protein